MRPEDLVAEWLAERIAAVLALDPGDVPVDEPFAELGLSSVNAVELSDDLQRWTGLTLSPTLAFDFPTIEAVAEHVAEEAAAAGIVLARPSEGAAR